MANNYYPFGLEFNSYRRVTSKLNNFLYNQGTGEKAFKTERISELDLNVDMTKFRVYDPAIGRFWQDDPKADYAGQESWSPYHYAFNNPIRFNDPLGDCPTCVLPFIQAAKAWWDRTAGAAQRLVNDDYVPSGSGMSSEDRQMINNFSKMKDATTVAEAGFTVLEGTAESINTIPGVDVVGDPLLAAYFGAKGDYESAATYAAAAAIPGVSGLAGKGLAYALKKTDIDLRGTGVAVRDALEAAFEKTGVAKEQFKVTKWGKDVNGKSFPVEYRAKGGAEVNLDFSHSNGGLSPDAPHIGWQTSGKGKNQTKGHIILDDVPAGRTDNKLDRTQY